MTDFKDIDKDDSSQRSSDSTETHADELKEDPVPKARENRKPVKYEIPITQVNEDDFRDKDGNVDGCNFAKRQSKVMLLGYMKNLQLLFRDCLINMKTEPLNEEEQKIWNDALLSCAKLAVEQFSMLELLEQKADLFKSDKDGKLELDPKQIDPYLKTLNDGSIVLDTEAMADDEAMAGAKMKDRISKLRVQYEKELEQLREERSKYENDKELHPEDYDKDGNLILRDEKWVEETKKAVEMAKEEIKVIRAEREKREAKMREARENKKVDKIEDEIIKK